MRAIACLMFASATLFHAGIVRATEDVPIAIESSTPVEPAEPSRCDLKGTSRGFTIDFIEGLACDGTWKWRAQREGRHKIIVSLKDENTSTQRSSCAQKVRYKLLVTIASGTYEVQFKLPRGYGSPQKPVTVPSAKP
jgi:hypothetical protein